MESSPDSCRPEGRRGLLRLFAFVFGGACGGAGLGTLLDPLRKREGSWRPLVSLADIEPASALRIPYPVKAGWEATERPVYLVRGDGDEVTAFDARCTHLGCTVRYRDGKFLCPCHRGVFDGAGAPLSGPVDKPLARVEVRVRNGVVEGRA